MAAGVGGLHAELLDDLFADLDALALQLAVLVGAAAAALVERELGVDQVAPVLGQPVGAVEGRQGLLAAGERQLDGALGLVVLAP